MGRFDAWIVVGAAAVLGCKSTPPAPPQAEAMAAAPVARAVLEIEPVTISFRGSPIARLMADGRMGSRRMAGGWRSS